MASELMFNLVQAVFSFVFLALFIVLKDKGSHAKCPSYASFACY